MTKRERAIRLATREQKTVVYSKCGSAYYSASPFSGVDPWIDDAAFNMCYVIDAKGKEIKKFYVSRNGWGAKNKKEKEYFIAERKRRDAYLSNLDYITL
jgi:hypothetical protein